MNDYAIIAVVAFVVSAAHRGLLIWIHFKWFRQGYAGDAAFHLAVVRELKKSAHYSGVPYFLIQDEPDAYPILFHRLAAILPIAWTEKWPYLPNAILWSVLSALCAVFAQYVGVTLYGIEGPGCGLVFVLFFLTLVSNFSSDMNGINYVSLSERLLSRICTGLYFAALVATIAHGGAVLYTLGIVAGAGALISSMFARQALAFTTPVFALLVWDPHPLYIFAASVALAAAFDRALFFRGVVQMVKFWYAYKNHTVRSRYYTLGHSKFVNLRWFFSRGIGIRQRVVELQTKEPSRLLFRFPELAFFAASVPWHGDRIHVAAFVAVVATMVVYVLTTTKWLRHLGEAIRYVEYNLVVVLPLILAIDQSQALIPLGLFASYGIWVALSAFLGFNMWSKFEFPSKDRIKEALESLSLESHHTLFTVPFTLGSPICARFPCRALMYQGSAVNLGLYEKFMEEVPYLKRDWKPLVAEFGVTHIIAEKSHLRATKELMGWEYDFSSLPVVAETDFLVAYGVVDGAASQVRSDSALRLPEDDVAVSGDVRA